MSKSNSNLTSSGAPPDRTTEKADRKGSRNIIQYGIFILFGGFYALVTFLHPEFMQMGNLYDVLIETSIISFVAFGEAIVITAGGLDLSVGNIAGFAAMLTCYFLTVLGYGLETALPIGMAVGVLIGFGNGLMVSRLHMNSLIATLGTMFVLIGFLYGLTGGTTIHIVPPEFMFLGTGTFLNIPIPVYVMAVVFVLAYLFMEKTGPGRNLRMIGGNMEACRLSGVNIKNLTLASFVLSGFLSTFSGILLAARQALGNVDLGERFVLEAFVAAMLGTVIFNGKNVITGTLIGTIFLVSLINAITLMGAGPQWMYISQGALLLVAILANYYSKAMMLRIPVKKS